MKALTLLLVALLLLLQYHLWVGGGSLAGVWRLRQSLHHQRVENAALEARNLRLEAEVRDLKQGTVAVEERARRELGMIRDGETFYQIVSK